MKTPARIVHVTSAEALKKGPRPAGNLTGQCFQTVHVVDLISAVLLVCCGVMISYINVT